ncbi:unnamed protein product [Notodromas monacha]|uniref:Uncharacterized protein n=1 Tax=Notodromas monacha TaxID=399045 RepID=A0A7R9BQQ4_9CRUS|nr:unnamed protein product [Notodromas monacha]CAG0919951.1 unnamed protein product [Notodromas monacha]
MIISINVGYLSLLFMGLLNFLDAHRILMQGLRVMPNSVGRTEKEHLSCQRCDNNVSCAYEESEVFENCPQEWKSRQKLNLVRQKRPRAMLNDI